MRTELLREFATLANYGNFHAAAEKLFISQPTLSNHIKQLESELGFELFDRSRNNEITAAGSILLAGAQAALMSIDEAVDACHRLLEMETESYPPVRLSVRVSREKILSTMDAQCTCPYVYTKYEMNKPLLYGFIQDDTDIICMLHVDSFPALKSEVEKLGLKHSYLGKNPCLIAMKADNPLAKEPLTRERLRGSKIAVLSSIVFGYWKSFLLDTLGSDLDLTILPFPVETLDNLKAFDLKDMILFSPAFMVNEFFASRSGYIARETVDEETLYMPESIVWRPREDNPNIEHVVELLRDCMKDQ